MLQTIKQTTHDPFLLDDMIALNYYLIQSLRCYTFNPISLFETSPGNFTSICSERPVFVQACAAYVS